MYFRNKVKAFCRNSSPAYRFNISNFIIQTALSQIHVKRAKGSTLHLVPRVEISFEQYNSAHGPMPNPIQNDGGPAVRKRRLTTHCSQMQ